VLTVNRPGLDPESVGIEANYAVPSSFTMDSGSGAGMTRMMESLISDLTIPK